MAIPPYLVVLKPLYPHFPGVGEFPFQENCKKLHKNQKQDLDEAVRMLMSHPEVGEKKMGDLAGI